MEMRAGRKPGRAYFADEVALRHALPHGRDDFAHVPIERLRAIGMRDNDIVAIAAVPRAVAFCHDDRTGGGGIDARAFWRANVNRVPPMEPLRDDAALERPYEVTRERRPAAAEIRLAYFLACA